MRECICFGCEAMNASGEPMGGLVKSRVEFLPAQIRGFFLIKRSPLHANFVLCYKEEFKEEKSRRSCYGKF